MKNKKHLQNLTKKYTREPRESDRNKMVIYALVDPRDGIIKYVGQTSNDYHNRHWRHCNGVHLKKPTSRNECWIVSLKNKNLKPNIMILETAKNHKYLSSKEIYWIKKLTKEGFNLKNDTEGGESGFRSENARWNNSVAKKEYFSNKKNRKKQSDRLKKTYEETDFAQRRSKKQKELWENNEYREKMLSKMDEWRPKAHIKQSQTMKIKAKSSEYRIKQAKARGTKPFEAFKDGKSYGIFESLSLAAEELGIARGHSIKRVLNRDRSHSNGFTFKYIDEA